MFNFDSVLKQVQEISTESSKKSFGDSRFWKLSRDENDNGAALLRLMPDKNGTAFIKRFNHSVSVFDKVKGKRRVYAYPSPSTINQPCPVSELWQALWNLGTDESRKEAKSFKRSIKYITNIKVLKDPAVPENEGKFYLWEFGTKLYDKFTQAMNPSEADKQMGAEPKNLYHPCEGNSIKLKCKKAAGFINYDDTEILAKSSVYENCDLAMNEIKEKSYELNEFLSPESYEDYNTLKERLLYVLEIYEPNFMDRNEFKKIVKEVLGESSYKKSNKSQMTETPKVENNTANDANNVSDVPFEVENKVQNKTAPEPVETSKVETDDDLSFLDELDNM